MNNSTEITFTETVEVWNSAHEGDVSVEVTIHTDIPADSWTSSDWEALGEFVAQEYVEGDETRDVRYTFNRFQKPHENEFEFTDAELAMAEEAEADLVAQQAAYEAENGIIVNVSYFAQSDFDALDTSDIENLFPIQAIMNVAPTEGYYSENRTGLWISLDSAPFEWELVKDDYGSARVFCTQEEWNTYTTR